MKRILFVDDELKVLEGLRRMLYPLRGEWLMTFETSAREALKLLSQAQYDVIVTDIRMPEMSGIELLSEVVKSHPGVTRIVLSGTADQEATLSTVMLAHQYLVKPCDAATLRGSLERTFNLRFLRGTPALKELISRIDVLPSLPGAYLKLMEAVQSPDATARRIGEIVAADLGMTSKVLQLVNSAFFGAGQRIVDPIDAVVYLGVETVRALTLSVCVFSEFGAAAKSSFSLEALHEHSLAVGSLARKIAHSFEWPRAAADEAFVGGLLHDVGKIVLATHYPARYEMTTQRALEGGIPSWQAEMIEFGATHAEIGAYLFWLWGLPDSIVEAIAFHHNPPDAPGAMPDPVAAIHIADVLIHCKPEQDIQVDCCLFGRAT